jgi:ribosome-binding factor A
MVDDKRKKRIGELIQHELANVLLRHMEQPIFKQISITNVIVSADLSVAKVFFSVFDDSKLKKQKKCYNKPRSFYVKLLRTILICVVLHALSFFMMIQSSAARDFQH